MVSLDETEEMIREVKNLRKQRASLKEQKNELVKLYHSTSSRSEQFRVYVEVMNLNEEINSLNQDIMTLTEELNEIKQYYQREMGKLNVWKIYRQKI